MNRSTESLAESLSDLFSENVTVDHQQSSEQGGVNVTIAEIRYRSSDAESESSRRVRQTVAVLDEEIHLPYVAMFPHRKGILGAVFSAIGGMNDVNFDDSPKFSADYLLHAWNEKAVRLLFTPKLREYFSQHAGWSLRGNRGRIAVFQQGRVCKSEELDEFVNASAEIFRLIREGEQELDRHPEINREARVQDAYAAAENMGGIAGRILRNELDRIALSSDEVRQFLAQPVPRLDIPSGMHRQVIPDVKMLIAMGIVFTVAGVVVPILIFLVLQGNDRLFGIPFAATFLLAGGLMLFFSIRHGRRKYRLLREGTVHTGRIERVERTNTEINSRRRYVLHVTYDVDGQSRQTTANVYSGIERARSLADQNAAVRVLVDPQDEKHVLCVDSLVIT
ncbi:hypothetical protein Enr13x_39420 [Stieleria neptunia]|uniref:Uncharacterized protein n=1 Tax=Stieleria neptunia TaxID=2527979 RepID=A0A518HTD8_9BACT|nr:DUF3592 domain-containing protein [Stieleria neptunia]QDV44081.1 hypothetical protein Enr13x_39420 [Stieleria neptunia]